MSIALMLGGSAGWVLPYSYQCNLMVYAAGNYRTVDFIKLGAPFHVWLLVGSTVILHFYDQWWVGGGGAEEGHASSMAPYRSAFASLKWGRILPQSALVTPAVIRHQLIFGSGHSPLTLEGGHIHVQKMGWSYDHDSPPSFQLCNQSMLPLFSRSHRALSMAVSEKARSTVTESCQTEKSFRQYCAPLLVLPTGTSLWLLLQHS